MVCFTVRVRGDQRLRAIAREGCYEFSVKQNSVSVQCDVHVHNVYE